jgi:pimeloyl-ACP methyl ester carboxylesterase
MVLAPGLGNSGIASWERSAFHPIRLLAGEFTIVAVDQRHAGRSTGNLGPFSYEQAAADQLAVLDALALDEVHLLGESIGCACAWRLTQDAPDRIRSLVAIRPVGILHGANVMSTFLSLFDDTIRVARAGGVGRVVRAADASAGLEENREAGPFGPRIGRDPGFRDQVSALTVDEYISLAVRFRDGMWPEGSPWFSVSSEWMTQCDVPMLVLPGNDVLHPRGLAGELAGIARRATRLDDRWFQPERLAATTGLVRDFLFRHTSHDGHRSAALTRLRGRAGSWSN